MLGKHGWEEDGEDSEAEAYVSDVKFNSIDHAGAAVQRRHVSSSILCMSDERKIMHFHTASSRSA